MSGHSKWATTKHKKAIVDAKRGKMFAKLIKNIEVAARMGGGDPAGNPTLYDAIQKAKKSSVPNDNIDRAVKRGSGAETGGADYQTIMYEGYGPSGVAMLIECLTDNRNRAAMEVRTAMTRNGGSLADPGSVSFLFHRKGVVLVPTAQESRTVTEDDILEATLEAGADDVNDLGETFEVVSEAVRPGGGPHRPPVGRHRLRLRRGVVRARHAGRARQGRGRQDVPARRRARGPRRRAEHLRQLRRVRTRSWRSSRAPTRDLEAPRVARRSGVRAVSVRTNTCSDDREGAAMRVLGIDPGLTRCGVGVVEGEVGRPLTSRRRRASSVRRRRCRCPSAWLRSSAASRPGSTSTGPTRSRSSGSSRARRQHGDGHRAGQRASPWWPPPGAACRSRCTRRARSRPRCPAAAAPTRPRSA